MARRTLSPEEEAQIVTLFHDGQNSSQIAKALGLAYQTVNRRVQKLRDVVDQGGTASSEGLVQVSTRNVYKGALFTFVHDISDNTIYIEAANQPVLSMNKMAFRHFVQEVTSMESILFGSASEDETSQE